MVPVVHTHPRSVRIADIRYHAGVPDGHSNPDTARSAHPTRDSPTNRNSYADATPAHADSHRSADSDTDIQSDPTSAASEVFL
jgi:hypothetical protein